MPCLIHPTANYPHIAFGKPRGAWWNRFTYKLANWALIRQSILGYGRSYIQEQGWSLSHSRLARFFANEVPVEYAFDERLFPRPADWPAQAVITQFRERNKMRIQAAVHHGGSGTTHSALRCGIPQAIIPHIADQFFWSRQMVAAGFGVEAFPIRDRSRELFAQVVDALQKHIQHAV
ncbi:hypothetical protein N9098_01260 [bacterium]|nr:hypothetical protein [bacterium]